MKLTPRLQTIADFIRKDTIVADIGTDHAYIPVYLLEKNICERVIATDINSGPLENAKSYIMKKRLSDRIETRLGNGLKVLKANEVNTAIIAGMGGLLIRDILEADREITDSIDYFVLQPMVASEELRRYLYSNGFRIENEKLAKEKDKMYEIITVSHGHAAIENEIYFEIGEKLIENNDELLDEFINKKLREIKKVIKKLENKDSFNSTQRYNQLKNKYNDMLEVLRRI